MTLSQLQATVQQFRQQILAREAHIERALQMAYQHTLDVLQPTLDALYQQIADAQANLGEGESLPLSFLYEADRLEATKTLIESQVNHFGKLAELTTLQLQGQGAALGLQSGTALLNASLPAGVNWTFGVPSPDAIANLIGATQAGSPLATLFSGFGAEAAQKAAQALITGLAMGNNPAHDDIRSGVKSIANDIKQALNIPLWRAQTIARTEALRSYRDANTETYRANSDVVGQWRWTCALSSNTCAACLGMDGELFDLDTDMESHPNCRCFPCPITKSWADILDGTGVDTSGLDDSSVTDDMQSGSDWFAEQDAATQQDILGKGAYDLYSNGDITLKDMVGHSSDPVWGGSIYQKSLKELRK